MVEFDDSFVQALEHRPKTTITEAQGIPLIDLSVLTNSSSSSRDHSDDIDQGLVHEIGEACKNWGFFQVINHGVPLEALQRLQDAAKSFFGQSMEEKRKVRREEKKVLGYYDTELTKNVRDWKEVFDLTIQDPTIIPASLDPLDKELNQWTNQWPHFPPHFRKVFEEYAHEMGKLGGKLMELIALSLGLPANRFRGFFKDETSFIRLNHYPPCPMPHLALGVGRHKDGGALTILAQDDVGGLEVKRKTDGEWIRVPPTLNAYIINVGDIIQVWSNEKYESVEHRVMVNSEKERFSIPYFLNPAHYTMVKPLEELITKENPAKYREYNWGKFIVHRKTSNFKNLGVENIQIHHFRLPE